MKCSIHKDQVMFQHEFDKDTYYCKRCRTWTEVDTEEGFLDEDG